jgi:hypothetical protein
VHLLVRIGMLGQRSALEGVEERARKGGGLSAKGGGLSAKGGGLSARGGGLSARGVTAAVRGLLRSVAGVGGCHRGCHRLRTYLARTSRGLR